MQVGPETQKITCGTGKHGLVQVPLLHEYTHPVVAAHLTVGPTLVYVPPNTAEYELHDDKQDDRPIGPVAV